MKLRIIFFVSVLLFELKLSAHPMPHSILLLDVKADGIDAELNLPLNEFQFVFPNEDLDKGYRTLIQRKGKWLDQYLLDHISVTDSAGHSWTIFIKEKKVSENEQSFTGKYHELTYQLWMQSPKGSSPRHFILRYDAIMHQLVTHKLFLKIKQDWYGGMTAEDSLNANLGVLSVNPADNSIQPVIVNLEEGGVLKGIKTMINLGMDHIAEGADHLLFLLVLLLPATLLVENKRWTAFGGFKYSIFRLLKTVTAFTIGHSISLMAGSLKWITLPQQPVEIAIAFTILVTAIHAIRPLFYGKEAFVAVGFGLIHGLAFSSVLSEMCLDTKQMAYSILGFNIGIELMQLFVIFCTVPWLMVLSKNQSFHWLRIGGALCAIIASFAWIIERSTGHANFISNMVDQIVMKGKWLILVLATLTIISLFFQKEKSSKTI